MSVGDTAPASGLNGLVSRIREMTQGRETIDVAQLQFVALDDIQRAYGERWPDQKTRIQDAAEVFLRRRIDPADLLVRGDNGFLVILDAAAGPAAHAVAAQLTHGLNAFFLGQGEEGSMPRFNGVAQNVATSEIEATFGGLDVVAAPAKIASIEVPDQPALEWRYEPVWDVRREILSSWYVTPFVSASGARLPGYHFETGAVNPSRLVKVDEIGLWAQEQALTDLLALQRPTLVGATVHIASLANLAHRARIIATIDRLSPALHRYRIIKIAGVGHGFPRMYLNEIVSLVKSRLPHVVLGASWDEPDMLGLSHAAANAIALTVPSAAVSNGSLIATPLLLSRLGEGVRAAHASHARLLIEGAISKFLALKLAAIGVDNIASHRIWPVRSAPEGMLKWPAGLLAA